MAAKPGLRGVAGLLGLACWLAPAWAAPAAAPATSKPALRFIVGEDWAWPYLALRNGRPVGGLAFDLMEQVARAADARPVYVMLPPKRTQPALHAGEAELMCMMAPKWVAGPLPAARIGPPMVVLEDVLAVTPGSVHGAPLDLAAQRGLRVGTVLGYHYQELGPLFEAGQLVRDDAATQQGVLEKLARGRMPTAVVDRLVLAQYNRGRTQEQRLHALQVVSQTVTHCLLGGATQWPAERLQQALRAVADRAAMARLLQRYR
ncbi:substrate-binding periplasmic protein [Roseateles sp. DC23W]|uniref:Substrate-binding periplasmic protein n=1 Tax=Pelomonas dachongensis TaxID=3299029 RepID=A0ABW7ENZ7_9BURK